MPYRTPITWCLISGIILLNHGPLKADWSTNPDINDLVTTYSNNQNQLEAISDGEGGVIIVWQDARNQATTGLDIYAQRLAWDGSPLWDAGGMVVSAESTNQTMPFLVGDGSGGVIVFWTDMRSGNLDIYAQRINSSGGIVWTEGGVAVADDSGNQRLHDLSGHYRKIAPIISTSSGGAYFAYNSDADGDPDIYIQRIDNNGQKLLGASGVKITDLANSDWGHRIVSDGAGGTIVVWENYNSGTGESHLYAQRMNSSGTLLWSPADGVDIVPDPYRHNMIVSSRVGDPEIVSDNAGGAIVLFNTYPGLSVGELYMQRIDGDGSILWGNSGKILSNQNQIEISYSILRRSTDEFYVVWADQRNFATTSYDIYAQKIDVDGNILWTPSTGLSVCDYNEVQYSPTAIVEPGGNLVIGWRDDRNPGSGTGRDIYAQSIDPDGNAEWVEDGVSICNALNDQWEPQLALSSAVGFIATWRDRRDGNDDVYASFVNYSTGLLGNNVILPVTWVSTDARQTGETITIEWICSNEENNDRFIVERSSDGINFSQIGSVPGLGRGDFKGLFSYSFLDRQPELGHNYYRVRQVDLDGQSDCSPIKLATFHPVFQVELYPNPADRIMNLRSGEIIEKIRILNVSGVTLLEQQHQPAYQVDVDVEMLVPGSYVVMVYTRSSIHPVHFVKRP